MYYNGCMKKALQIANILSVIFAIAANAVVSTSSAVPSISSVSATYETLLTPASYAFSIWILIYAMSSLLALYQARDLFAEDSSNTLPKKLSGWFILANIMNGLWTYIFVNEYILLSVVVITTLLISLGVLIRRLDIALKNPPIQTIAFVWWPILLYTGWVLVATVVNTGSLLQAYGITISALAASGIIIMLGFLLATLLWTRNLRSLVLASTWGIAAVAVSQYSTTPLVWITAATVSALLVLLVSIHAYKNRDTNPLKRLLKG